MKNERNGFTVTVTFSHFYLIYSVLAANLKNAVVYIYIAVLILYTGMSCFTKKAEIYYRNIYVVCLFLTRYDSRICK